MVLQLALGAPFLLAYPASYIGRAFEFTRVGVVAALAFSCPWLVLVCSLCSGQSAGLPPCFPWAFLSASTSSNAPFEPSLLFLSLQVFLFTWTVNWKFLPEGWFVSPRLALVLLAAHLRLLWSFAQYRW